MESTLLYHDLTVIVWLVLFSSFLVSLVFVVSAEAFIHTLLYNISGFADLGRFQFSAGNQQNLFWHGGRWRSGQT